MSLRTEKSGEMDYEMIQMLGLVDRDLEADIKMFGVKEKCAQVIKGTVKNV